MYKYLVTAAAILVVYLTVGVLHIGSFCYVDFALTGSFAIHVLLRRQFKEPLVAAAVGAAFAMPYILRGGGFGNYTASWIGTPGAYLGIGCIVLLITKATWAGAERRAVLMQAVRWTITIPLLCIGSAVSLTIAAAFTPTTYDLFLHAFDMTLGLAPSFVMAQFFRQHVVLSTVSAIAYNSLPLYVSVFMWVRCARGGSARIDFARACVTLGILGFILYQVCPGAGPLDSLGKAFPYAPPILSADALVKIAVPRVAVRNAMPSLHIGWILLCFWHAAGLGWKARVVSTTYLVLTILATLGFGEHFLIDLVVAVPLCLCVQAVCMRGFDRFAMERLVPLAVGGVLTLGWLAALRTGIVVRYGSPGISWSLILGTVVVACVLESRLRSGVRWAVADIWAPARVPQQ